MKKESIKIAPSVLSADFSKMGEEIASLESSGADFIHCDVMDGVFVPNITFGIKMIADIKKTTKLPLDVHLMIVHPEKYVERFAKAGAEYITVHYEACKDNLKDVLLLIRSHGAKCGCVINPDTSPEMIKDVIPLCDIVVVMSVFPGFGGQSFIPSAIDSIKAVKKEADKCGKDILIEVDGGVNFENSSTVKVAGANVLVAGNTVFSCRDRSYAIKRLREQ